MRIYLDLIFFINLFFDFIILTTEAIILKRNISLKRIFAGSIIGSLTIFVLFIKFSSLEILLMKFILSIVIIYVTFGFKSIKYFLTNLLYFYTTSIVLGGFLYFINIQFGYKNNGIVFYNKGLSLNMIFILIVSPLVLYLYIKQNKSISNFFDKVYKVDIYLNNKILHLNGYFDTGNMLVEPYKKRKVIIISKDIIKELNRYKTFLVPCKTISSCDLIKCLTPNKVIIHGLGEYNDLVIGISNEVINIDGIECILNSLIKEKK